MSGCGPYARARSSRSSRSSCEGAADSFIDSRLSVRIDPGFHAVAVENEADHPVVGLRVREGVRNQLRRCRRALDANPVRCRRDRDEARRTVGVGRGPDVPPLEALVSPQRRSVDSKVRFRVHEHEHIERDILCRSSPARRRDAVRRPRRPSPRRRRSPPARRRSARRDSAISTSLRARHPCRLRPHPHARRPRNRRPQTARLPPCAKDTPAVRFGAMPTGPGPAKRHSPKPGRLSVPGRTQTSTPVGRAMKRITPPGSSGSSSWTGHWSSA